MSLGTVRDSQKARNPNPDPSENLWVMLDPGMYKNSSYLLTKESVEREELANGDRGTTIMVAQSTRRIVSRAPEPEWRPREI